MHTQEAPIEAISTRPDQRDYEEESPPGDLARTVHRGYRAAKANQYMQILSPINQLAEAIRGWFQSIT